MKNLILMMGVCCSGKTVYVKKNFLPGFQYISEKSLSKGMVEEKISIRDNKPLLYAMLAVISRSHMIQKLPLINDDKNLSVESLVLWRKIANEHSYIVTAVLMDTPLEVCRKRLKQITDIDQAEEALITDFERLEDMKPILFSKHHSLELFDKLDVIKYGGREDEIL